MYSAHIFAWWLRSGSMKRIDAGGSHKQRRSYYRPCSLGSNRLKATQEAFPQTNLSCLGRESGVNGLEMRVLLEARTYNRRLNEPSRVANRVEKSKSLLHTVLR